MYALLPRRRGRCHRRPARHAGRLQVSMGDHDYFGAEGEPLRSRCSRARRGRRPRNEGVVIETRQHRASGSQQSTIVDAARRHRRGRCAARRRARPPCSWRTTRTASNTARARTFILSGHARAVNRRPVVLSLREPRDLRVPVRRWLRRGPSARVTLCSRGGNGRPARRRARKYNGRARSLSRAASPRAAGRHN